MLRAIWARVFAYEDNVANREGLRRQLVHHMALALMGASSLAMWMALPTKPFPLAAFSLWAMLLGLGLGVQLLLDKHPTLARHVLVWGLTAVLLRAMWQFFDPWLPFLSLLLIFVGAILVSGSEFVIAGAAGALAVRLTSIGARVYPLPDLFLALALGLTSAWLAVRTIYTALDWVWNMHQEVNRLLEETRAHRAELSRVVKSLRLSNTLLRRTQRELVFARRQAEEAQRMKEQFAANISHELRTPLSLILGFSEVMYLSPEVYGEVHWPPPLRRDVHHIYRNSRHLLEMIDDVLDLSRFEIAGFPLNKEPTPLEPLLQDTVEIAEDLFRGDPACLEVRIARDLPTLEIDRTRIRQVLLNLLKNARRFAEAGTVMLEAKRTDGEVVISVSDTGPGISQDKLPHIFDEFYQVDQSLRRSHQGAGLGLAISKRFVQAHDGRIWVESEEGCGAMFSFTLPIPDCALPVAGLFRTRAVEPSWPDEPRPCVLVIDADPAVASFVHRHTEEYEVVHVEDPRRLDAEIRMHHPRAVVYNVPPGGRQGRDCTTSMSVPLIECSLPSQAWVAHDLAVAACLTKPFTAERLLREIQQLDGVRDVLVVDDDRGIGELVKRILATTDRPFDIRRAYDGREGLTAMRSQRPDLVLLDLIMPNVDGFGVLDEMQGDADLAGVPVILLTVTSYAEDTLAQHNSQVVVRRPGDSLQPAEVVRCLRAAIGVLEPRYDEASVPEETLTPTP